MYRKDITVIKDITTLSLEIIDINNAMINPMNTIEWRCDKYAIESAKTSGLYYPIVETNHHNHVSNPERIKALKALEEVKSIATKQAKNHSNKNPKHT